MSWAAIEAVAQLGQAQAGASAGAQALQPLQMPSLPNAGDAPAATAAGASFGHMVSTGLDAVNGQLLGAQTGLQQLATGSAPNLHQVMIDLEEARLSFQLMMQVRNRLLESYQDVMKMQV
ncbi:flagellar hook-basal body complex protein FliE [Trinickia fusca]|uniref:Flagellar hook-basal body complex protein FliE n=1 Tax=Trinickia fusca TaxID=2419777 RepID=A0A494XCC7_9BURK|nr:flagellar hook-basal body complex protein FliE [Trinickia fusca]RKP48415.1 flagellar hook-basal body complex protein FliE [Trinickia fusca]